ncbi:hypothetical protein TL18_06890 [Methanobrevibacter sp. YE315]|uniref:hypothetical protein n=1 Tax=Methanobrevibacter sp. YE315 TaxID=1609968 RepID=UPI000764DAE4|nr:hypothetical protein [Methanobrevibacter sp. YE315]AMD17766.1 hypothetical protein TL18_06890 [Methanobrevibacter sp. YE315]
MNKKYLIAIIAILLIVCAGAFALTNSSSNASTSIDANALEDRGNLVVDSESLDENNGLYHTDSADLNAILVKNSGTLKLANSIINKTGDTASTGDDADFYGINSAILVNTNGTLDISNVEINTNSKGSNGIFVTNANASSGSSQGGEGGQPPEAMGNGAEGQGGDGGQPPEAMGNGAEGQGGDGGQPPEKPDGNGGGPGEATVAGNTQATIKNVKITTHSDKSRGLDATYNGIINAENVIINTDGQSCAALATDRGEGQVHVKNSDINTGVSKSSGRGSPLIYSTGNITLENTKGTSYVSQIACIEGKNSIELEDCDLKGYGEGNRQDGDAYVDLGGVFIYQSMSGDASVGTSHFKASNSKLTIPNESSVNSEAPMFHVTNTACVIDLDNTELSFGSGVFLEITGQNQWGNEGSNGGVAEVNTNNEKISGNVIVDAISSLNWTMKNTEFKGVINSTGNTTVNVADGSTWTLTGDSAVSNLKVSGNIDYGDHTLTVNGQKYDKSNPFKG